MAKIQSVTVSVTVTPEVLAKIITGAIKGIALAGQPGAAVIEQPKAAKVYDETTCVSIESNKILDETLDGLRGSGMIKRVQDCFKCDYGVASTLVSAHSAAKKAKRDAMLIVPAKADAIKAIVESCKPKAVLIKTAK